MSPKEIFIDMCIIICRLPRWRSVKNLAANAGDIREAGLIPGLGRPHGGGHGNPLQCSCLENPTDRGAYGPWGHKELDTTEATSHSTQPSTCVYV